MPNTKIRISLADVPLETWNVTIVDELDAITRQRPHAHNDEEGYSLVMHNLPSLVAVAARGRYHAGQLERFLDLASRTRDHVLIQNRLPSLLALTMLNHAATIAIALLPALNDTDDWIRGGVGRTIIKAAKRNQSPVHAALAHSAFGLDTPVMVAASETPLAFLARADRLFTAANALAPTKDEEDGAPRVHGLERAGTLADYITERLDLEHRLGHVRNHLRHADDFAAQLDDGEISPAHRDRLGRAQAGAMILAIADLARIGLWPARSRDDQRVKDEARELMKVRHDPDRQKAIVELAFAIGEQMQTKFGAFIARLSGVEL